MHRPLVGGSGRLSPKLRASPRGCTSPKRERRPSCRTASPKSPQGTRLAGIFSFFCFSAAPDLAQKCVSQGRSLPPPRREAGQGHSQLTLCSRSRPSPACLSVHSLGADMRAIGTHTKSTLRLGRDLQCIVSRDRGNRHVPGNLCKLDAQNAFRSCLLQAR